MRWKFFSQSQNSIEYLTPTKDALHYKVLQSHYIANLLKSVLLPVVCKRDPTLYGWYYDEGKLLPVTSVNELPAPTNMISLTVCSCTSRCNSNRCWCKKYYLNCSDACKCLNCKKVAETKHSYEQAADSNSDYIRSLSWKTQAWKLEFWITCFILGVNFYSILIKFHNLFLKFQVKVKLLLLLLFFWGLGEWQLARFDLDFKKGKNQGFCAIT